MLFLNISKYIKYSGRINSNKKEDKKNLSSFLTPCRTRHVTKTLEGLYFTKRRVQGAKVRSAHVFSPLTTRLPKER